MCAGLPSGLYSCQSSPRGNQRDAVSKVQAFAKRGLIGLCQLDLDSACREAFRAGRLGSWGFAGVNLNHGFFHVALNEHVGGFH